MRKQYNTNLVIIVLNVITALKNNYILLFKYFILIKQKKVLLKFIIYYKTKGVFKGME